MQILIVDDKQDSAQRLGADIAADSKQQIRFDLASGEVGANECIATRRRQGIEPYGVLLIDQRLSGGIKGLDVMPRLLKITPESEVFLFTTPQDSKNGLEVELQALKSGVSHYFDRMTFKAEELMLRLNEVRALREFDRAVLQTQHATTQDETAQWIVQAGRLMGFERARLWRLEFDNSGTLFARGWVHAGNKGLDGPHRTFRTTTLPVDASSSLPRVLKDDHDVCLFSPKPAGDPNSSYLWRQFGDQGYLPPQGYWAAIRLKWDGPPRAVLMLDNVDVARAETDARTQRLLLRFARSASSALARAEALEKQQRAQKIAHRVDELIANQNFEEALKEIMDQLIHDDKDIARTPLKIVLKNYQSRTADYRYSCCGSKTDNPYRRSLDDSDFVPYLLKNDHRTPLLLKDANAIQESRRMFGVTEVNKPSSFSFVYIPLCVDDKVTGALVLDNDVDETIQYTQPQVSRLKTIASEIAAGVEAGRLREEAEKNNERQKTLIEARKKIDEDVKGKVNQTKTWHLVLTALTAGYGLGFNRACLFLQNRSGSWRLETGIGSITESRAREIWNVFRHSKKTFLDYCHLRDAHTASNPQWSTSELEDFAINRLSYVESNAFLTAKNEITRFSRQEAADNLPANFARQIDPDDCALIPVRAGERVLGVVYVDNHAEHNYITQESLDEAESLLAYAAQAIQNQRERDEYLQLLDLNQKSFDTGSLKDNLQEICDAAVELTDADLAIIYPKKPDETPDGISEEYRAAAVASGYEKSTSIKRIHSPDGLTSYVLDKKFVLARDVQASDILIRNQPLAQHSLVTEERLRGLISIALYDSRQQHDLGVLHLGFRREPVSIEHDKAQAKLLGDVARRAVRTYWLRQSEEALRGEEAKAHHTLMEMSLRPNVSVEDIAKKAAILMRSVLGEERVDQVSTVFLRQWEPATDIKPAFKYRVDYQVIKPNFAAKKVPLKDHSGFQAKGFDYGISGKALSLDEPINVPDVSKDDYYFPDLPDTRSELAYRLKTSEGEIIGVLNLESSKLSSFTKADEAFLKRFANILIHALENAERRERTQTLLNVLPVVVAPSDLEATLDKIIEAARKITEDVTTVTLWYVDWADKNRLCCKDWGCYPDFQYDENKDDDGKVRREKVYYISKILDMGGPAKFYFDATKQDHHSEYVTEHKIASTAHMPLVVQEGDKAPETIGVMFLNFRESHVFTEEDKELLQSLASIAAASIRDANVVQKMGNETFFTTFAAQAQEMAHDLREQVNLMTNNIDALEESDLGDVQTACLQDVKGALEEMREDLPLLIDRREDIGRESLECVAKIAKDWLTNKDWLTKEKNDVTSCTLKVALPENILVDGNRTLIKRIIVHLLRNAIRPSHFVKKITIQQADNAPSGCIRILIEDDGIGLSTEVADGIFRHPLPTGDKNKPLSVGLMLARRHAEFMGGYLSHVRRLMPDGQRFRAIFALDLRLSQSDAGGS